MRKLLRAFFAAICLALCLFAAEGLWFVFVLAHPRPAAQADLLAVYGGTADRYGAGWALEREGKFRYLVLSDASVDTIRRLQARFGKPHHAGLLLEPSARTTAQNARYVARLILKEHCVSVLVLTSWWHLPRALFLTHLALLGSGVRIQGWGVGVTPTDFWDVPMVWRELARFWGSLLTYRSDQRHGNSGASDEFFSY